MKQEFVVLRNDAEPMLPGRTIHPDGETLRRAGPGLAAWRSRGDVDNSALSRGDSLGKCSL
jgi:hypothetical protein